MASNNNSKDVSAFNPESHPVDRFLSNSFKKKASQDT